MSAGRKRLIEVAFPLEEVSTHSRTDNHGPQRHISQLHGWWARRPLAACRAFIYASLVDDPGADTERDALLREVADLASWSAVRHPDRVVRNPEDGAAGWPVPNYCSAPGGASSIATAASNPDCSIRSRAAVRFRLKGCDWGAGSKRVTSIPWLCSASRAHSSIHSGTANPTAARFPGTSLT